MLRTAVTTFLIANFFIHAHADTHQLTDSIETLIHKAITHYPSIQASKSRIEASYDALEMAKSSQLPQINFNGKYGSVTTENPSITAAGESDRHLFSRENNLSLIQKIYDGGKKEARINLANAQYQDQKLGMTNKREELMYLVLSSYIKVKESRELLVNAQENVAEHQRILNMVQQRVDKKVDSKSSSYLATGRSAIAESKVELYTELVKSAELELASYTGEEPKLLAQLPSSLAEVGIYDLKKHPSIAQYQSRLDAAEASVSEAQSAFLPSVQFELVASEDEDVNGVNGSGSERAAFITLDYNLYAGGSSTSAKKRAIQLKKVAQLELDEERLQIATAVKVARSQYRAAKSEHLYFKSHRDEIEKAKAAYQSQYVAGHRTLFDLLNIQSESFKANESLIQSFYKENLKAVQMKFEARVLEETLGL